jgi:hypothetical protein
MKSFPPWGSFLIASGIIFGSIQVARLLPLTEGWTIIAAGCIAGALGFLADQWAKRRDSGSG